MATVTFTYDHARDPMNPGHLARQIGSALGLARPPAVDINPTQIIVAHPGVTEANREAIQATINYYVYDETQAKLPPGNEGVVLAKIDEAIATNIAALALPNPTPGNTTYLDLPPIPSGTLTAAALGNAIRPVRLQVDALTRQNNALRDQVVALTRQITALERHIANRLDDVSGT